MAFGHPQDRERNRVSVSASEGGRTKQSFQFDADPNTLMRQFVKTGKKEILEQTQSVAQYGDFSEIPDFFTALIQVQQCTEEFNELPVNIRVHVNNSPAEFLDLVSDPDRHAECVDLGLFEPDDRTMSIPQPPEQNPPAEGDSTPPNTEGESPQNQ